MRGFVLYRYYLNPSKSDRFRFFLFFLFSKLSSKCQNECHICLFFDFLTKNEKTRNLADLLGLRQYRYRTNPRIGFQTPRWFLAFFSRKRGKTKKSIFPNLSLNNLPTPPEESKTRCGDSFCITLIQIRAKQTDFVICCSLFFQKCQNMSKTMAQQLHIFQLFPKAPAPRPPGTLPPSKSSFLRFRGWY